MSQFRVFSLYKKMRILTSHPLKAVFKNIAFANYLMEKIGTTDFTDDTD
jgi:hypothetical protein